MRALVDLKMAQIISALVKASTLSPIFMKKTVMIPEADMILCIYKDRRFNINVDVAYGAEIRPVDKFSKSEIAEIEALVMANLESS